MDKPTLVNARIDALVNLFDEKRAELKLTNGEMTVLSALFFAGALKEANDKDVLTLALGAVLYHMNDKPEAVHTWAALFEKCSVKIEGTDDVRGKTGQDA